MGRGCQKRRLCGGAKLKVFLVLVGAVHSIPGAVDESYLKSPEVCRAEGSRGLGKIKCREGSAHLGTTVQLLRGRWAVRKQVSGFALPQPHFDLIANDPCDIPEAMSLDAFVQPSRAQLSVHTVLN